MIAWFFIPASLAVTAQRAPSPLHARSQFSGPADEPS
jgi:hypothetical protein